MAVPIGIKNGQGTVGGSMISPSSGTSRYSPNTYLDASLMDSIKSAGYIMSATSYTPEYVTNNFKSGMISVQGKGVAGFYDNGGSSYVINETGRVFILSTSPIDKGGKTPTGGSGVDPGDTRTNFGGGGGGTIISPPNTGVNNPIGPYGQDGVTGNPSGGGGGGGPIITNDTQIKNALGSGKIFTSFNYDDIIPNQQEIVTRALWSNNEGNLLTYYTSSEQTVSQKRYYYEIFNSSSADYCCSDAQFSVAYGHKLGSGSADLGGQIEDTPNKAIYGQYRLLCLDPKEERFTINGTATDSIYAININRARMREFIDEGNIEINLACLSGSQFIAGGGSPSAVTGSNVKLSGTGECIRLIDDSKLNPATIKQSGEVYNIVSGSIEDGIYNPENPHIYGLLFRRKGIVILDGTRLDASASFATVTGREVPGDNAYKLFTSISGSAKYTDGSGDYLGFKGRGGEIVKSTYYSIHVKSVDYNFSNNPTFTTGSSGDLRHPDMINDPKTYITSIGLYNQNKELVAIAKVSEPIKKSFKEEELIQIKLDF